MPYDDPKENTLKNIPVITIILIAANIVMFLISLIKGGARFSNVALSLGADYWPYVFFDHQYWRLFTSMFLHFGFMHIFGNMIYLAILGSRAERQIGRWRFLVIYLASGIGASLVSCLHYFLIKENTVSAGASGAVYGLLGLAVCNMLYNYRRTERRRTATSLGLFLVFLVYSNFMSAGVDYMAHVGGFVVGFILSLILVKRNSSRDRGI